MRSEPAGTSTKAVKGGAVATRRRPATATLPAVKAAGKKGERYSVEESRAVRTPWVWRGFFMLSMLAIGVVLVMLGNGKTGLAIAWVVIACGWFATSMWLWRQHRRFEQLTR